MFIDVPILLVCLFADALWRWPVAGVEVRPGFILIFCLYQAFRSDARAILPLVPFFLIGGRAFFGMGFFPILISLGVVMSLAYKVRSQIYTEAYLTQGAWVFLFVAIFHILLSLLSVEIHAPRMLPMLAFSALGNALFSALVAIPVFVFWDRFFDRMGRRRGGFRSATYYIHRP